MSTPAGILTRTTLPVAISLSTTPSSVLVGATLSHDTSTIDGLAGAAGAAPGAAEPAAGAAEPAAGAAEPASGAGGGGGTVAAAAAEPEDEPAVGCCGCG